MAQHTRIISRIMFLGLVLVAQIGAVGRLGNLEERILASHNRERIAMRVPPLRWNPALAAQAQAWAEHLVRSGRFEHSPNLPGQPLEGENIWGGTSGAYSPELMVGLWIDEKAKFISGTFPRNSRTGDVRDVSHYTQLIWSRTGQVGCALAQGGSEEILVCRYSEPGNIVGARVL